MGERRATWDERKAMKIAYLEALLIAGQQRYGGKIAHGERHNPEFKRFVVEMIDVYCSHSLPIYASFQRALGLSYATVQRWRKTIRAHRGQYVSDDVRWALDNLFNYTKEDTDE